jgi:hypothetical protein
VHLGQGRGSQWRVVEVGDQPLDRLAELAGERPADEIDRDGRHLVLQAGQFPRDGRGQQVRPGGKRLGEFDEDPARVLQGVPHRPAGSLLGAPRAAAEDRDRSQPVMSCHPYKLDVPPDARESRGQVPEGMRYAGCWQRAESHLPRTR